MHHCLFFPTYLYCGYRRMKCIYRVKDDAVFNYLVCIKDTGSRELEHENLRLPYISSSTFREVICSVSESFFSYKNRTDKSPLKGIKHVCPYGNKQLHAEELILLKCSIFEVDTKGPKPHQNNLTKPEGALPAC